MDPQRWDRLSELFEQALDLPTTERNGFADTQCADDDEMRSSLRRMLAADSAAQAGSFLGEFVAAPRADVWQDDPNQIAPDYEPGTRQFGPYRLLRLIGEGGMGQVHLAERSDGAFEQRVALKLLPHPTPGLMQRFRQERQILARLEHANIARLLDGGLGADNVPYFAMEYVDGKPISRYSVEHALDIAHTLQLFLQVCDAVQYAHRNLVVHRDLKPSNILVSADGVPKLLDFGIAKLLQVTGETQSSRTVTRVFTPDYAAPEQIRGEAVTTATDVYALGVVLYELLAGRRPYALNGRDITLEQAILTVQPLPPSAAPGASDPLSVQRRRDLRGDLDRVVLTALAKEPERRYSSVEAFAGDVRSYLEGRPIAARGDGALYRLRKFVRRNRIAVSAAVIVACALVGATVISIGQARIARQEASRAETVKQFLVSVFESNNPDENKGETLTARQLLDRGADRIDQDLASQPVLQAELNNILGTLYYDVGVYDRADALQRKALAASMSLPDVPVRQRIAALRGLADVGRAKSDYPPALKALREAKQLTDTMGEAGVDLGLDVRRDLAHTLGYTGEYAATEKMQRELLDDEKKRFGGQSERVARDLSDLAGTLEDQGRHQDAVDLYRDALVIKRAINGEMSSAVASTLNDLARALDGTGKLAESEQTYRRALAIHTKLEGPEHPNTLETISNLCTVLNEEGKSDETLKTYRYLVEVRSRVLGENSADVATTLNNLAVAEHGQNDDDNAEIHLRRAIAIWKVVLGERHPSVGAGLRNLGAILRYTGHYEESEKAIRESLDITRVHFAPDSDEMAKSEEGLGNTLLMEGRYDDALKEFDGAMVGYRKLGESHSSVAELVMRIGEAQLGAGRIDAADQSLQRATDMMARNTDRAPGDHALSLQLMGRTRIAQGRFDDAEKLLRAALDEGRKIYKDIDSRLLATKIFLAEALIGQQHADAAEPLLKAATEGLTRSMRLPDQKLLAKAKSLREIAARKPPQKTKLGNAG